MGPNSIDVLQAGVGPLGSLTATPGGTSRVAGDRLRLITMASGFVRVDGQRVDATDQRPTSETNEYVVGPLGPGEHTVSVGDVSRTISLSEAGPTEQRSQTPQEAIEEANRRLDDGALQDRREALEAEQSREELQNLADQPGFVHSDNQFGATVAPGVEAEVDVTMDDVVTQDGISSSVVDRVQEAATSSSDQSMSAMTQGVAAVLIALVLGAAALLGGD